MRMKMTPTEILNDLLNSESFDELVSYRLKISLETSLECLHDLYTKQNWTPYQFEDYVETLRYARALVVVLEWFTVEDMVDTTIELNKLSLRLDNEF